LVKAKLISHKEVFKMDFEAFERLEKFNLLIKDIEDLQQKNNSSSTGNNSTSKGGLTIKRDGTYERE
jgi:hypothetical protein